jgi:hypothetical protein
MKDVPADTMIKDTGKLIGKPDFETDAVRFAVARIIGVAYAGESEPAAKATTQPTASPSQGSASFIVPEGFELEGSMSINDVAATLKTNTGAVIRKLGLPADIPVDKPLRDLKDTFGFSMPGIKELIKK